MLMIQACHQILSKRALELILGALPPPTPETAEGGQLWEAFLVVNPFMTPAANQAAAPLAQRLEFQAFPATSPYMLILARGYTLWSLFCDFVPAMLPCIEVI